jgi:uncharacterized membrane protein YoaK (UPF0700 family)
MSIANSPRSTRVKFNLLSLLCIFIVGVSWCTNIGWIRIIFMIPMIVHAFIFFFSNRAFHKIEKSSIPDSMRLANFFTYATYLLCNALLPDGGDTEDSIRVFFGLIHNGLFIDAANIASELLFIANIGLISFQFIHIGNVKRRNRGGKKE